MYVITFEVTGGGSFPVDMLRYDTCFPSRTQDAVNIQRERLDGPTTVRLVAYSHSSKWTPTEGRWNSFMWTVSNVHGRKF